MPRDQHHPLLVPSQSKGPLSEPGTIATWLARGDKDPAQIMEQWAERGLAIITLGRSYSAVRIPARLLHAVAGTEDREEIDTYLAESLRGPVICDPRGHRYYALVPPRMIPVWQPHVEDRWRALGVELLGADVSLGVPRPGTVFNSETYRSYWAVPMAVAGGLCAQLEVTQLLGAASRAMAEELET
jgi:hypothetical protein